MITIISWLIIGSLIVLLVCLLGSGARSILTASSARGNLLRWGVLVGLIYGLALRVLMGMGNSVSNVFEVMSLGFLFFVPLVMGNLLVTFSPKPSWVFSIFGPWEPILLFILATGVMGW